MAAFLGPAAEWRRPGQQPAELIAPKAGHLGAFVVRGENVPGRVAPGEEALAQRAVGEHADIALLAVRQDGCFDFAVQEVVAWLQGLEGPGLPGSLHLRYVEVGHAYVAAF